MSADTVLHCCCCPSMAVRKRLVVYDLDRPDQPVHAYYCKQCWLVLCAHLDVQIAQALLDETLHVEKTRGKKPHELDTAPRSRLPTAPAKSFRLE